MEVRNLTNQLNSNSLVGQFTMFVPTNEAMLLSLSPGQLESIGSDARETRQFLLAHLTGELVVPKLPWTAMAAGHHRAWSVGPARVGDNQRDQASSLYYSLAGGPLRVVTTIAPAPSANQTGPRLELIVNGANVLGGHSHALQEPNNSSATYAIVHLIDRSLYPEPRVNLYQRLQQLAPRWSRYLAMAVARRPRPRDEGPDEQLQPPTPTPLGEQLQSMARLTTALVPNDEAFRTMPSKLLDQLETNRTFLEHFVRSHLIEGLYFSGQLQQQLQQQQVAPFVATKRRLLSSMANSELEFDTKQLQARNLLLVNSIPILESDLMASNGVVHLLSRPILERHQLEACNCQPSGGATQPAEATLGAANGRLDLNYELLAAATSKQPHKSATNWFSTAGSREQPTGNQVDQLEREESQQSFADGGPTPAQATGRLHRSPQRSESGSSSPVVARNNRDFYRPSAAPVNLQLTATGGSGEDPPPKLPLQQLQPTTGAGGRAFIGAQLPNSLAPSSSSNRSQSTDETATTTATTTQPPLGANSRRGQPQANNNSNNNNWTNNNNNNRLAEVVVTQPTFEVERYKVVLNATSRQKLRESSGLLQQMQPQSAAPIGGRPDTRPKMQGHQFSYDQPTLTLAARQQQNGTHATTESAILMASDLLAASRLRPYSPAASAGSGQHQHQQHQHQDQLVASSMVDRRQRLLRFQADEAVHQPAFGNRSTASMGANQHSAPNATSLTASGSTSVSKTQPLKAPQLSPGGKTSPPAGGSFGGCAFYDTECKRLVGKLSRLPQIGAQKTLQKAPVVVMQQQQQQQQPTPPLVVPQTLPQTTPPTTTASAHLDSTFGETTEGPLVAGSRLAPTTKLPHATNHSTTANLLGPSQFSLPPRPVAASVVQWNSEQLHHQRLPPMSAPNGQPHQPQHHDEDISRIVVANRPQQQVAASSANGGQQIVLVPVEMAAPYRQQPHRAAPPLDEAQLQNSSILLNPNPIYFGATSSGQLLNSAPQIGSSSMSNGIVFTSGGGQFHRPSARPQHHQVVVAMSPGRLTNFTALETTPDASNQDDSDRHIADHSLAKGSIGRPVGPLDSSGPFRPRLSPVQLMLASGAAAANRSRHQASALPDDKLEAIKQARKIVRLQTMQASPAGDISVTSAKLTSSGGGGGDSLSSPGTRLRANQTGPFGGGGGLATQASNSSPEAVGVRLAPPPPLGSHAPGGLPVRSLPLVVEQQAPPTGADEQLAGSAAAAEFFQNRTIGEIMDDSGLRIDGQQVTFARLKECLQQADLLSLVSEPGSSLTIFMPTDLAFQRLVQQQAILQQRERQTRQATATSTGGGRLADPLARRHLIPLISYRLGPAAGVGGGSNRAQAATATATTTTATTTTTLGDDDPLAAAASSSGSSLANRLTLDCSASQVRRLLLDHLAARLVTPRQLTSDTALASLSGKQLLLSSVPSKKIVVVDGQPVVAATRAKNGMVYVVNKFLNMSQQAASVAEVIEAQPNLTTFMSYLTFSSLANRLRREAGPITVLAPTNEAFEQLSPAARQLINSDPSALADILRGHVVEGVQFGKLISMRNKLKTLNSDQSIEARVIKPNTYQLDNQLTSIRLIGTAANGVVNAIDRLIVPPWLRVSMSSQLRGGAGTSGGSPLVAGASTLPAAGFGRTSVSEADLLAGTSGNSNSNNLISRNNVANLPNLNNKPVTFNSDNFPTSNSNNNNNNRDFLKQPIGLSNSFLLAGVGSNSSADPSGNSFDSGFDVPSDFGAPSSDRTPFSRSNNNLDTMRPISTASRHNAGQVSAFAQGDQANNSSQGAPASVNNVGMSKNMQLIGKLASLMKAHKFVRYLASSRLGDQLKPDMNYVLLVPTDQAIDKLPRQIIDMLDRDAERLADLVSYHVLDTTFEFINTIPDGQTLSTLNEKDILFNWHRNNTVLTASGAVVLGGIQEDNIALLIVDRVLYPTPGDLLSIVAKSPILSNFTKLIKSARLEQQLRLPGPYTLFAPSDVAFQQLDTRDLEYLHRNPETARRFLLRHLSQPAIFTSSIALTTPTQQSNSTTTTTTTSTTVPTMSVSNSLGEELTLRQRNDYFSVNEVNFSYADVAATNGVMHVIDGLL